MPPFDMKTAHNRCVVTSHRRETDVTTKERRAAKYSKTGSEAWKECCRKTRRTLRRTRNERAVARALARCGTVVDDSIGNEWAKPSLPAHTGIALSDSRGVLGKDPVEL